jgi:hypothetical protein
VRWWNGGRRMLRVKRTRGKVRPVPGVAGEGDDAKPGDDGRTGAAMVHKHSLALPSSA